MTVARLRRPVLVVSFVSPSRGLVYPDAFIAHLGRAIPELRLTLPANAIGKDYLPAGEFFAHTPSGTGYQASLAGLFGIIAGGDEGFELNVLGLVAGIDFAHPALKLPGIGRIPS